MVLGVTMNAWSDEVKFKSTGEGDIHQDDGGAVGDPLGNKPVDAKQDAGSPLTRQSYSDDCKDDRCTRAEKRQKGNTTWQEDRQSGLHKSSSSDLDAPSTAKDAPAPQK